MKRTLRNLHQIKNRQTYEMKHLNFKDYNCMVIVFSPLGSLGLILSIFLLSILPFPSPLQPFFRRLSSHHPLPAGHHPLPPLGGHLHLRSRLVFLYLAAAWTVQPFSTAESLTPLRLTLKCHSSSHERGSSYSASMSNLSLILSHGYAAGLFSDFAILLQEADGTGIGSLQDPPWHKRPSTVEETLVQFSLCQSYCPSDYWEIDSQAENRSNSALQQENLQELAETAGSLLQTQLSRLDISFEPGIMAHLGNNLGLQDIMKNL